MPNDLSLLTCGKPATAPGGGDSELGACCGKTASRAKTPRRQIGGAPTATTEAYCKYAAGRSEDASVEMPSGRFAQQRFYRNRLLGEILAYIQSTIDSVLEQLSWLATQKPERISMLAPFLGRSLLELSTTALIGRLDPLRLLVVRQIQAQPEYDTAILWNASIRWQGDVVAKKEKDLWGQALEYQKVTRALLGEYYDHLVWRPAVQRMVMFSPAGGAWLAQLAGIDVDAFVVRKREEIGRLYSSLSKGIHHEFVMPPGSVYDRTTIVDLIRRTVHTIADLALVSQFIPHALSTLPPNDAVEAFNRIENMEVIK